MIDGEIVAQNHKKNVLIFKEKFAQKVIHNRVFYIPKSSLLVKIPVTHICIP